MIAALLQDQIRNITIIRSGPAVLVDDRPCQFIG